MKTSPPRAGKFFRLRKVLIDQLAHVAEVCGIEQQQIVDDALTLYFNPSDPGVRAQHKGVLRRMRMDGGALPLPRQPAKAHRRSNDPWAAL